jgi:hypothetical protein
VSIDVNSTNFENIRENTIIKGKIASFLTDEILLIE